MQYYLVARGCRAHAADTPFLGGVPHESLLKRVSENTSKSRCAKVRPEPPKWTSLGTQNHTKARQKGVPKATSKKDLKKCPSAPSLDPQNVAGA